MNKREQKNNKEIQQNHRWFFKKINKTFITFTKKKEKKNQITKLRNKSGDITNKFTKIRYKRIL